MPVAAINDGDAAESVVVANVSDTHLGMTFDTPFGRYDSDIARARLLEYADRLIQFGRKNNTTTCKVALLGDLINGSIHYTIAVKNREDTLEQVQLVVCYLAEFIARLRTYFTDVAVRGVSGNHSRLTPNKKEALKDERFDKLVLWGLKLATAALERVDVNDKPLDTTIEVMDVLGKTYVLLHGGQRRKSCAVYAQQVSPESL